MKKWENSNVETINLQDTERIHDCGHLHHGVLGIHIDGKDGCKYHPTTGSVDNDEEVDSLS